MPNFAKRLEERIDKALELERNEKNMNKGEQAMEDINESVGKNVKVKGSMVLGTVHDEKLLVRVNQILDERSDLDRNSAGDCQKAIKLAKSELKVASGKKVRYHVDLSEEMGKDFSVLAEKMGLTLSAVVKLFLMDDWQKLKVSGFDYIYLGIADRPKAPGEIPF